jgi:hypothetical protein
MDIDRDIHAIIGNPSTSYWLSDALKAALKRDPIDAAHDAEQLASLLTQRAQEQTANAVAWLAVQRAATGE